MPFAPSRRRVVARLAIVLTAVALVAPLVATSPASADQIGDKAAEARKIAAQLDQLQHQAEVYSEQYNAAVVELQDVQTKVDAAAKKVAAANTEIASRRGQVAKYAVGAYIRGGDGGVLPLLLKSNGVDMGQRQGYVNAAIGNREELINQLNAARDDAAHDISALNDAKTKAQAAKDAVDQRKRDTESAVAKQTALNNQVQGELANLVAAEQARRAAEQQRLAEQRAAALAAAAAAAAPPAAPATLPTGPTVRPTTGGGGTTTTTTPPTGGNGGGGNGGGGGGGTVDTGTPPPSHAGGVVGIAESQLGTPYVWGGASPGGFDCSGLVYWAFAQAGISVPRVATAQYNASHHIPLSQLQPGDLVFYGGNSSFMDHVAIYVGGGTIIHAPHSGSVVKYDSLYYWSAIAGAGRI